MVSVSPGSPSATSEQHCLQGNFKRPSQVSPKTFLILRLQNYDDKYMKKEKVYSPLMQEFKVLLSASSTGADKLQCSRESQDS